MAIHISLEICCSPSLTSVIRHVWNAQVFLYEEVAIISSFFFLSFFFYYFFFPFYSLSFFPFSNFISYFIRVLCSL